MKKILLLMMLIVLCLVGCSREIEAQEDYFTENYGLPKGHMFRLVDFEVIEEIFTDGDGAVLFSFPTCPWCQEVTSIINEAAEAVGIEVNYYDPKDSRESEDYIYEFIMSKVSDNLTDVDGEKRLLVPHMFYFKDGEIVYDQFGTFEGHNPNESYLTEDQKKELLDIYTEGFQLIKE